MKKRVILALVAMVALLAACSKANFGVVMNEDLKVEITAENATVDSMGQTGTFIVEENETIIIEPNLDKGSIKIQFIPFENPLSSGKPVYETELSGNETVECELSAGDYMVAAIVTKKANGNILITKK